MDIGAGIKWVGREGTGAGATERFCWLILRKTSCPFYSSMDGEEKIQNIKTNFMNSAALLVMSYGPTWAKQAILGRALGVWLLAILWIVPPTIIAGSATCKSHKGSRDRRPLFLSWP